MKDVLLNESLDLLFINGDLATGYSNTQHEELLLLIQKGSLKVTPLVGVGIQDYINSGQIDEMLREARHQFGLDGMEVKAVAWDDDKKELSYDAKYNS